ncbi:MAG: prolipoprotein diacylglyceryl transferase [Kiritimatiellae bacterium]|nr:prolipoprotein diacylglyceryl transferase [Kiritimatiellia bacterium]MBR4945495.1 prolipoprotein diacylglyceryl transferase [Kiritimatiellia bacterium]
MYPEIFKLGSITIQSYGLFMAIGFAVCFWVATQLAKRSGRNPDEVQTIIMLAAVGGILGARIVYVWQNWATEFAANPLAMFQIWRGGLVFYGGFLMAALFMLCYAKVKRERILSLTDFCAVLVPLGHCFGRLGCFFFGCCYGRLCPEAWYGCAFPKGSPAWYNQVLAKLINPYAEKSLPVTPIQLIEALGCFLLFAILWWCYRRYRSVTGLCSAVYCAGYAGLRFILEYFRDDPRGATYFGFSFSQMISFALLAVAILLIAHLFWRKNDGTVRS